MLRLRLDICLHIAPINVKYIVETIIVFLPNLSAKIESKIRPVTLPTNSADKTESLRYLLSQYKFIWAVIESGKLILH